MKRKITDNLPLLFFLLCIFLLVVYKLPHLSLPFFQDEAWVYGKAVRMMADKGISLLPDALDAELVRGHPLLFHNFYAVLLTVMGNTIFNAHLIALGISISFLFLLFFYFESSYGKWWGFVVTLLLMIQPIFLAQCGLVLPEMLLAALLFLSIRFFVVNRFSLYFLTAACAILVKESAIVMFLALSLFTLLNRSELSSSFSNLAIKLLKINLPITAWMVYLQVHHWQTGSYFFHEHIDAVSFELKTVGDKLQRAFYFVFLAQGRNVYFLLFLISLLIVAVRSRIKKLVALFPFLIFIFMFLFFSSVNYYADRYLLASVFFFVMCTVILFHTTSMRVSYQISFFLIGAIASVFSFFTYSSGNDQNPGYLDAVKVNRQGIDFLKNNLNPKDTIYCWFNTHQNLRSHYSGYVDSDFYFRNLRTSPSDFSRYYIFTDIENSTEKIELEKRFNLLRVVRFESGNSWFELMKRP